MKKITITLLANLLTLIIFAQKFTVTGVVVDSGGKPLESAACVLLNSSDSSLINFSRSNTEGVFKLKNIPFGTAYTLRITYVGDEPFLQDIPKDFKAETLNVGAIRMVSLSKMLDAALVTGQRNAVTFKNDTTEFDAAAFRVQPNATGEDLLKKLPGVEVDKDGNVKAQGEQVKQVFVNGKKFFSNDPKIATQNLPAGAIKKVQIFDKKSDQAEFSGVDDGQRDKTINFELKEEYSKGTFGNITAGAGTDNRYTLKGGINKFSKGQQLSVLGLGNNINKQGFSFEDYSSYTGMSQRMAGGGAVRVEINGDNNSVPLDFGRNSGFTTTWAGGVNFNKQLTPKTEINANYFYNNSDKTSDKTTDRQNFLPNRTYYTNSQSNSKSLNDNHRLNLVLDHKLDSFNTLKLTSSFSITTNTSTSKSLTSTSNAAKLLENFGNRFNFTEGSGMNLNNTLLWRHRFQKKGRTLTANFNYNQGQSKQNNDLNAVNDFYDTDTGTSNLIRRDSTLQTDDRVNDRNNYGTSLTYTEPIAKRTFLEFTYSYKKTNNDADRKVDTIRNGEHYFNSTLSNVFNNDFIYHRGGINLRYTKKEINFSTGVQYQESLLRGLNVTKNTETKPNPFRNFLPTARFSYEFTSSQRIGLDYDTDVKEPSIDQLQPISDNSDPLNIYQGNPALNPEYNHRVRLRYNNFNQANMHSFFGNFNFNYTLDKIVNEQVVTRNFVRITRPVNVKDAFSTNGFVGYNFPINPKWRFSFNDNTSYNRSISLVNQAENITKRLTSSNNVRFDYRLRDSFDFSIGAKVSYNNTAYSLQSSLNRTYFTHEYEASFNITLPWNLRLVSDFNYQFYTGQNFGANQSIPIWNAAISKLLFKNKKGELKLAVLDILNKNTGFTRTTDANYIQDEFTASLRRYAMLSFTYAINPLMGAGGRGGQRMMIRMGN